MQDSKLLCGRDSVLFILAFLTQRLALNCYQINIYQMKRSLGRSQSDLNCKLSDLGVILLAVRKSLKCLLAAVCNTSWTRERMERTAKRLAAIQAKVTRDRISVEAVSVAEADAKAIKEKLSTRSRWPQADIQYRVCQGC